MATITPNFGWAVPTSSDLVKNGATAIETLGDSIDASLVDLKGGTTGQVLKKATNTDMDFVWSADSAGMTNPMTTTGDTIYSSSGSTPARLGIGTTGQVLTVASGVPSWATPAGGGGKVLQVVQGTSNTSVTIASTTFTDTTLSATITPTSSSSKILVFVMQDYLAVRNYQYAGLSARLLRGATEVFVSYTSGTDQTNMGTSSASADNSIGGYLPMTYLDSPATTSATTYKTQFKVNTTANGATAYTKGTVVSSIILMEIGA
jgi:hypothetical protein